MAIKKFDHLRAKSLKEAAAALAGADGGGLAMAGGTDAMGVLKDRIHKESPRLVVNIKAIPGLSYIAGDAGGLRIGALTTLSEIAAHKTVKEKYKIIAEAARSVASPQLRNMATIGGNLCQEPRCWYYRTPDDQFHCLRKGGTHCGALLGENRYHSVFGGARVAPPACTAACPGGVNIADYLALVRAGEMNAAAEVLLGNNPLPAMTGRVCPHLCEGECNRGSYDEAVSIRAMERVLGNHVLDHAADIMKPPARQTNKKVAVVGSGPAGLAAAYYLRSAGHRVTVFDRLPRAGGMLAYAIPAYRLPRKVVAAQIAALEAMGIVFKLNTEIGRGTSLRALRKDFDGVFLATGTWEQKNIRLEKAELLTSGMAFLVGEGPGCVKPGGNVLVIGGGNVAVDVAVTARRAGAKSVTMVCLEARDAMPAFPAEIDEALKAGVRILPGWGPQRIIEAGGKVKGMEFTACSSVLDAEGRFNPVFDAAQKKTIKADQVILAIGQAAQLGYAAGVKTLRGLIAADGTTQATNLPGVFAGGDAVSGPSSVIHAIAAGRRAALAIDVYLGGKKRPAISGRGAEAALLALNADCAERCGRTKHSETRGLTPEGLSAEAKRCIDCSCVAVNASDLAPALAALGAKIKTTRRTIAAEDFFAAGVMRSTVLDHDELVQEIMVPAPKPGLNQGYHKFRIRNSIDFPIAGLAGVFSTAGGKIRGARLVLSAAAPVPLRLKAVEEFLEGKPVGEKTAAAAGEIAAKEVRPLAKNRFKVQIIKALLQKALGGSTSVGG
ncbi:MAG TPA: pyridine nucleotide-disulfide oxidoreductase [Elusimicrobia bacterium]|nr:pyridine nucleotide-disulfide oxidoreductase [Elusimicrobiota bacterium]